MEAHQVATKEATKYTPAWLKGGLLQSKNVASSASWKKMLHISQRSPGVVFPFERFLEKWLEWPQRRPCHLTTSEQALIRTPVAALQAQSTQKQFCYAPEHELDALCKHNLRFYNPWAFLLMFTSKQLPICKQMSSSKRKSSSKTDQLKRKGLCCLSLTDSLV